MANHDEVFTRRFGGGKRTYYLDVKRDARGAHYIVISESTRKPGDKKLRNRVMVWREDFESLFRCIEDLRDFSQQLPDTPPPDMAEETGEEDEEDEAVGG